MFPYKRHQGFSVKKTSQKTQKPKIALKTWILMCGNMNSIAKSNEKTTKKKVVSPGED